MKNILIIIILVITSINIIAQEIAPGELKNSGAIVPRDANQTPGSALYVFDKSDSTFKALTGAVYVYALTVANGATSSDTLNFGILRPSYLELAYGAEGTELSFKVYSENIGDWIPFKTPENSLITVAIDENAARYYLEPSIWCGVDKIQVIVAPQLGELKLFFGARIY